MLLGQVHSPANPIQGSAYSTYGYQASTGIVAFSVGDLAVAADDYVTRDASGAMPTVSVSDGILTFSTPQTHSYFGIGDLVTWSTASAYVTKKINTREWEIRLSNGDMPSDSSGSLVSIQKAFATLAAALPGAMALIGADLVDKEVSLLIPCYELASSNSAALDVAGWTTTPEHFIKIFAPNNVSTECNKTQRHGVTPGGFTISNNAVFTTTPLLKVSSDNVIIDGICLFEDIAVSGNCDVGIEMAESGVVSNCMVDGFNLNGIKVTESTDEVQVIGNVVYSAGGPAGITTSASTKVVANTVYQYQNGIEFPAAGTYAAGNCVADCSTADYAGAFVPTLYYCCSDDATAGTANGCVSSTNADISKGAGRADTLFKNPSSYDFRLLNSNDERKLRTGIDLRTVTPYFLTHDAAGVANDDTPSMGAFHTVPMVPCAIGDTSNDRDVGGVTFSITNGLLIFSGSQTDPLLSAGCVLTHGGGSFTLLEKVAATIWRVTDDDGMAPTDVAGGTAITNIYPKYDSVAAAVPPAANLVTNDTSWEIICVESTGSSSNDVVISGMTSDETRGITVYAPLEGDKCNSLRRHVGVWDDNLMFLDSFKADEQGNVSILGMQLGMDPLVNAVHLENELSRVEACIIKGAAIGVYVRPGLNTPSTIAILNNIIYDCDYEGVKLENDSTGYQSEFNLYNNTVYNNLYGISFDGINGDNRNIIRLVNNVCLSNQKDYVGDGPRSPYVSTESNWSSDASAFSYAPFRNNDIFKTVTFRGLRDFHIPLAQHLLMPTGYTASADPVCQVYIDVDSESRPDNIGWSIGADQYNIPTKSTAYFSVGDSYGSDLQGSTPTFDVVGSIATFSESLDASIGIGDKVNSGGADMYLAERGSDSVWRVVDGDGAALSDFSDTVTTIERVSDTVSNMLNTGASSILTGGKNLSGFSVALEVTCYQDGSASDPGNAISSGWFTTADYDLKVYAPYDVFTQCGTNQRHEGVWSTSYFHMAPSSANGISIQDDYVSVYGLQIDCDPGSIGVDNSIKSAGVKIERCIMKNGLRGVRQLAGSVGNIQVNSNIMYDMVTAGVDILTGNAVNNTVVGSSGATSYNGPATATFSNCIAQGTDTGFAGLATKEYCVSQDSSAGTASGCKSSVTLDFLATGDYHLARNDFEVIGYGNPLATNVPERDIDSTIITEFSIGAHCPDYDTIDMTLSCGEFTSSFSSPGMTLSIEGSVATFSLELTNPSIMVGDKVTYDTPNKYVYLSRKISTTQWVVLDEMGQVPDAASSKALVSIARTFNSIPNLFDTAHAESIAQFYGDATNPFTALDKGRMNIAFSIAKDGVNPDPADITGYTADSENHFTLFPPVEGEQANSRHMHLGYYDTAYAAMIRSSTSTQAETLGVEVDYTEVRGLQITGNGAALSGKDGISTNSVGCKITDNIVHTCNKGITADPLQTLYTVIANNVVANCGSACIETSITDYVLNNTADTVTIPGAAVYENSVGSYLYNNIAQYSGVGQCYADGVGPITCLSEDSSLAAGNGNILNTALTFVDAPNYNYNLIKADVARGAGTQIVSNIWYPFNDDMIGTVRGRFWDLGALEYKAVKTVYYSLGTASGYQTPPAGSPLTIEVDEVDGESIGVFNAAQTSSFIMSGDTIFTGTQSFLLAEKIDSSTWRVTENDGTNVPNGNYNVVVIYRTLFRISDLDTLIIAKIGSNDLISEEVQVNVTVGGEGFPTNLSKGALSFPLSDTDYFFRMFAPNDITKHCNVSQRHSGIYGSGASLPISDSGYGLQIYNTPFFELEGVEIRNSYASGYGVNVLGSAWFLIEANIIRGCALGGLKVDVDTGVPYGRQSSIINNIVNGCGYEGVRIAGAEANIIWVTNNTIVDCARGVHHVKGESGGPVVKLYNNIFRNLGGGDVVEDNPDSANQTEKYYNISADETAGDLNHNINNLRINFVDDTIENFELDPDVDSFAIDSALDMQSLSPYYYDTDMRGIEREELFWDRGALERNENAGSGTMLLGPLQMQNNIGLVTSEAPTKILYIRSSSTTRAPLYEQFDLNDNYNSFDTSPGAKDLNDYLAWNVIDNIIIYVEGGETATIRFEFADRGDRTVHVMTDPVENLDNGNASIVYAPTLIRDTSVNGGTTFSNLKIYSQNNPVGSFIISASLAGIPDLTFINCIVQINKEGVTANTMCRIHAINSMLLYFNRPDNFTEMHLNNAAITGQTLINTIILTDSADANTFVMGDVANTDWINNCMTWNYGSGTFGIDAPGRALLCQENVDPELAEVEPDWMTADHDVIMTQSDFKPGLTSPVAEAGNNSVLSSYSMDTDILGKDRTFEFTDIDIGPYELEIHVFDISGSDIQAIDQIKCEIDRAARRVVSLENDLVYTGLFERFKNDYVSLEEFIREENITISLKQDVSTIVLKTDKPNELLAEFEANYDAPTRTILVKKIGGELSRKLGQMLESNLYVLHFNEQQSKLSMYLNKVATLGVNGTQNPVKNVKFGGNPTFG